MTGVRVFPDPEALGNALAREVLDGVEAKRQAGGRYVLGCPGGRSPRTTYRAFARVAGRQVDLGGLIIAMMDEYVVSAGDGFRPVPADAHHSCRRFAAEEIVAPLNAAAMPGRGIRPGHVWLPDPAEPEVYDRRLEEVGGVDMFIIASGASDGHVAFVPPATALDSRTAIVKLADTTRRDNLATFPGFRSLDEVPSHGVSVGLGTIRELSRSVRLVIHGADKRLAAKRVLATREFDEGWPATFVHRCHDAQVWLDRAALESGS